MRLEADSTGSAAFLTKGGFTGLPSDTTTVLKLVSGFRGLGGGVVLGISTGAAGIDAIFLLFFGGSPTVISLKTSHGKEGVVSLPTVTVGLLRLSLLSNSVDMVRLGGAGRSHSSSSGATTVRQ